MLIDIRDITRQKQAETVLVEMDRMKSEFISTAAHELRTPLATMLGYTELVRAPDEFGGFTKEQLREFLDEIYLKGETLSRIIDEMLDISRIESGHPIALDLQPHEPRTLLSKVVRRFELQSPKHIFHLALPGRQPEVVTCDLHRMTQVFENLVSNAVKYSPRGGMITVSGETVGSEYIVSISDQGIGMTPEQREKIFEKFYRADSSNTAIGGLGLGMSIARQIVEVHGGRIWVESEPGVGTRVSCTLPLARESTS
jgi:signal transduction histidine kinase